MEVAPEKAKERREAAAKDARVERWAEDSGNAALMGCELPPDEVLAADQRITAWAKELRPAGLEGGMDVLRARAFLDLLLGKDSRPRQDASGGGDGRAGPAARTGQGRETRARRRRRRGRRAARRRPGSPGGSTLTVPLATVTGLADRPGELPGIGPVDPWLARDLAAAAAQNPKTTWCVTVTDRARPRRRARLRPARTQESPETRRTRPAGPARVHLHARQPGRAARRVRHLAAAHPRTRARPDHHPGIR